MAQYNVPRGMRDFYPEEMACRDQVFDAWRHAASSFGFSFYDSCVVESLDLLKRKGGEEITEQIYAFKDKSDRDLALRPEMTPTLARMVVARQGGLRFPLKWSTIAQCFRYERMTKGRRREHYQWNLDIVGEESVSAEAEVIATALTALAALGLDQTKIVVCFSSRRLLSELLANLDVPNTDHAAIYLALDKRGKLPDDKLRELVLAEGISASGLDQLFDLMASPDLAAIEARLPSDSPAIGEIHAFQKMIADQGFSESLSFDLSVIRGLGYYTGIVFECFDREKTGRAIFGGGRYENLLNDLGGTAMPAVGIGFGDVVITDLLQEHQLLSTAPPQDIAIGFMTEAEQGPATRLAHRLRTEGRRVDVALHPEKPKAFFSRTGKGQAAYGIYLGPDDVASGQCRLKNLSTRDEELITLSD